VDGSTFWAALAVALVFEGLVPLLAPRSWRQAFTKLMELRDGQLRFFGLCSVGVGVVLYVLLN
jgi:uncharacterized protein YjeT (DUF2065 family)